MQDIDFICSGKVTGVKLDKGWCYVSCSKCFKKLHRSVSTLTCQSCNNTNAVGVLRYVLTLSSFMIYVGPIVWVDTFRSDHFWNLHWTNRVIWYIYARYRVEMSIADSTGEALFVAFDGVMAKLSTSWYVLPYCAFFFLNWMSTNWIVSLYLLLYCASLWTEYLLSE